LEDGNRTIRIEAVDDVGNIGFTETIFNVDTAIQKKNFHG
jgi:hypothetical protein